MEAQLKPLQSGKAPEFPTPCISDGLSVMMLFKKGDDGS